MADTPDLNAAVYDCLDRARIADAAAELAAEACNPTKSKELAAKARRLRADAEEVDPTHTAPAWADLPNT
jgi:hypothetical protein